MKFKACTPDFAKCLSLEWVPLGKVPKFTLGKRWVFFADWGVIQQAFEGLFYLFMFEEGQVGI